MPDTELALTEFITALRNDLQLSIAGAVASGASLRFALSDIEIDVEIKAARTIDGNGGVKVKFIVCEATAGAKAGESTAQTHRVKLKLSPVWQGDERYKVMVAAESKPKPK